MITSGQVTNIQVADAEVGRDYIPLNNMPDPVAAMMMTEYAKKQARKVKIQILKDIVTQRNHRRGTAILNDKEIREITAKIEENKISMLKLHNMNNILEQSRSHYIDEAIKKYDEENPCKEAEVLNELLKLEEEDKRAEMEGLFGHSNWGSTVTTDARGSYIQQLPYASPSTDILTNSKTYGT